ncbi:ribonuclease HI [Campylobacter devanensis]|uniref:ribonuclease HI n=1 Tax=Campylobacter devanensis TaxID=3161138 RepID=UPI000A33012C|nr:MULTISPECIES: ribonuclease HI [unclassified Campylobacter]
MKIVSLFSDGSCLNNPGNGGWAYILEYEKYTKNDSGAVLDTTNNQMELLAIINGLKALKEPCIVNLYTDSSYAANGINSWLEGWKKKSFKNVKNIELWQEIDKLTQIHKVKAHWIKAHAGHPQNELCDKLAKDAAMKLTKD